MEDNKLLQAFKDGRKIERLKRTIEELTAELFKHENRELQKKTVSTISANYSTFLGLARRYNIPEEQIRIVTHHYDKSQEFISSQVK